MEYIITKIRDAVYGEDVREALINGFEHLERECKFLQRDYKFLVAILIFQEIAILILGLALLELQL